MLLYRAPTHTAVISCRRRVVPRHGSVRRRFRFRRRRRDALENHANASPTQSTGVFFSPNPSSCFLTSAAASARPHPEPGEPRLRSRRDVGGDDARSRVADADRSGERAATRSTRRTASASASGNRRPLASVARFSVPIVVSAIPRARTSANTGSPPRGAQQRRQRRRRVPQIRSRDFVFVLFIIRRRRDQDAGAEHRDRAFEEPRRAESPLQRLYGLEVARRDPTGRVEHQQKHVHAARRIDVAGGTRTPRSHATGARARARRPRREARACPRPTTARRRRTRPRRRGPGRGTARTRTRW